MAPSTNSPAHKRGSISIGLIFIVLLLLGGQMGYQAFYARQTQKSLMRSISGTEAFYLNEIAAFNAITRDTASTLTTGDYSQTVDRKSDTGVTGTPTPYNPHSYVQGEALNVLATVAYDSNDSFVRRLPNEKINFKVDKSSGTYGLFCGEITYPGDNRKYRTCVRKGSGASVPPSGCGHSIIVGQCARPAFNPPYMNGYNSHFSVGHKVIQPDGKILLTSNCTLNKPGNPGGLIVFRILPNGQKDLTFGTGGMVTYDLGCTSATPSGLSLSTAGDIDVEVSNADWSDPFNPRGYFTFLKLNPDGSVKTSWGTGGLVWDDTINWPTGYYSSFRNTDDTYLIAASKYPSYGPQIFRYLADGTPDSSWNPTDSGTITIAGKPASLLPVTRTLSSGAVVAIYTIPGTAMWTVPALGIVQFTSSGSLNSGFGVGGIVTIPVSRFLQAGGITETCSGGKPVVNSISLLEHSGKILISGTGYCNYRVGSPTTGHYYVKSSYALMRFNLDGSPDLSFGTGGMIGSARFQDTLGGEYPVFSQIQTDNKILTALKTCGSDTPPVNLVDNNLSNPNTMVSRCSSFHDPAPFVTLWRVDANGHNDTSYGPGGLKTFEIRSVFHNHPQEPHFAGIMTLQPDNSAIISGALWDGFVARVLPNGTMDNSFGTSGYVYFSGMNCSTATCPMGTYNPPGLFLRY